MTKVAVCKPSMTNALEPATLVKLKDMAAESLPKEICGFVLKSQSIIYIENVHPNPYGGFAMQPDQQVEAMRRWKDNILGVFHSHPSGHPWPSEEDHRGVIDGLAEDWYYWIVTVGAVFEFSWAIVDNGIPALQS